jgi:S-formylglutathione hydrolase
MGGCGALKLVFAHPERYVAAAALSPAVFPGDTVATVPEANRVSVLGELLAAIEASPADALSTRLTANAAALRAADGPALFIAVGDGDDFRLHDGTEHLHRAMWDLGVSHEYVVRRGGTHAGPEMFQVQRAALAFIGAAPAR